MVQIVNFFGGTSLYHESLTVFRHMPLAARVDGAILCVHGGLGPDIINIRSIQSIRRPIDGFDADRRVDSLVWSDPSEDVETFDESTTRGSGYRFGRDALSAFLKRSNLSHLVRAHECVADGIKFAFDDRLVTVFSASNYCGVVANQAAVLAVTGPKGYRSIQFPPLQWLTRAAVTFGRDAVGREIAPLKVALQGDHSPRKRIREVQSCALLATIPNLAPAEGPKSPALVAKVTERLTRKLATGRRRPLRG
jgi:diadenosine tetraphosphatase ApaH/serine/threonine PP2A family protein phosphatase